MNHLIDGSNLVPKRSAKQQFRKQIFEAWDHLCAYCNAPADTLDHVKPRHKGGATIATNLVPACQSCNRKKGSEDWHEWFLRQEHWREEKAERISKWIAS